MLPYYVIDFKRSSNVISNLVPIIPHKFAEEEALGNEKSRTRRHHQWRLAFLSAQLRCCQLKPVSADRRWEFSH